MTKTGYNAVALLALVAAVVTSAVTDDRDLAMAMVVLAGTVVGRGEKAAA